jgi:hypothetical protein
VKQKLLICLRLLEDSIALFQKGNYSQNHGEFPDFQSTSTSYHMYSMFVFIRLHHCFKLITHSSKSNVCIKLLHPYSYFTFQLCAIECRVEGCMKLLLTLLCTGEGIDHDHVFDWMWMKLTGAGWCMYGLDWSWNESMKKSQ